jgi:hypothetical protein
MKKAFRIFIVLAFLLALLPAVTLAHHADDPEENALIAGQYTNIGSVNIWNDADYLYVEFVSTGDCMLETHVHVAESIDGIPQTKKNNPIPGQFEYSDPHGCVWDYTYPIPLTWAPGTSLFVAAHSATGVAESMWVFSDGGGATMVTAGNVPGSIYPYPAVDTWEAFNDPPDETPSIWDQRLTYDFTRADWIWEDYRVVDPTITQNVTFENIFTVSGFPNGGMLYIATDNTYSVSLNGEFIGEHTDWLNWQIVGEYEIYPESGSNVLQVIGSNYGDSSYNLDNNPAGVIFEAEIDYYADGETAWCDDGTDNVPHDFAGKNWATYCTYTVQEFACPAITSHTGVVTILDDPLNSVRYGESPAEVPQVFEEYAGTDHGGFTLDINAASETNVSGGGYAVDPGTPVCSYYVHFDDGDVDHDQFLGSITFEENVIGLIVAGTTRSDDIFNQAGINTMCDTDAALGNVSTTYPNPSTCGMDGGVDADARGLEISNTDPADSGNQDPIWINGNTVEFDLNIYDKHDSLRIILPIP